MVAPLWGSMWFRRAMYIGIRMGRQSASSYAEMSSAGSKVYLGASLLLPPRFEDIIGRWLRVTTMNGGSHHQIRWEHGESL